MKYAVVITDGAAGYPLECNGGKTTLEAAKTPAIDALATAGMCGMAKNIPDGLEPSSNIACTSIIGYDPSLYPIGRGAIEGAAIGVALEPGQIAMRMNLCCVSEDGIMKSYSAENISNEEAHAFVAELQAAIEDDTFKIVPGTGFRSALVVTGHPEIMEGTFYAPHNFTDKSIYDNEPEGPGSDVIASFQARAHEVLAASPLNASRLERGLLPVTHAWAFWPGMKPLSMAPFKEAYGLSAGMLSGVDLLQGLAKLTDMQVYHFDGVTDGPNNDYAAQGAGALKMLEEQDVVFIHVESPDAEGHDGNAKGKIAAVENIDKYIVAPLMEYAQETGNLRIAILPDHPTPVVLKTHSREMVPFVIGGPGVEATAGSRLTEAEGALSGIVLDPGFCMLSKLIG